MEIAVEGDELKLAGCGTCATKSGFDRGRAGIVKLEAAETPAGYLVELLHELHFNFGGKIVAVHELL